MIDPFSLGVDNCDMLRLSSLGLLRCFNQILPHLSDLVRNNIYLQLVPLDAVFQLSQVRKSKINAMLGINQNLPKACVLDE